MQFKMAILLHEIYFGVGVGGAENNWEIWGSKFILSPSFERYGRSL
jgi:hypothetical protein